ncbi:hypothetical protein [Rhodococcus sp. Q]|uniref:hypothetical protein n=1 Tax=Rhodococcus sp. Q TaxID=2502252 RepID=UPI002015FCBE|nr:hypothetical protein [Rhodococcus sp. Q]
MTSTAAYLATDLIAQSGPVTFDGDIKADIEKLLGYAAGVVFVLCLAKMIFVGARLAWDHKHGAGIESPTVAEFIAANVGAILAGGASIVIAGMLLAEANISTPAPPNEQGNLVEQIQQMPKHPAQQGDDAQEDE